MKRYSELWLSGLILLLAIPVLVAGLLWPSIYRDPAVVLPQNLATDVVTLCVGIPLLGLAGIASWRGSLRGRLLWLGALAFLVYDYGMYALALESALPRLCGALWPFALRADHRALRN